VSDPSPLLDRAGIEDAFRRLGERLASRGVVADLYVFGGAAMALAYDSRRATRDVDALFEPHGVVHDEALAVAAELGLPRWWLNEQASSYVAPGGDPTEDIRQLVQLLDLHTVDEVLASVREIFPEEAPPARLRLLLEDIFSDTG
jgi:hypothetical protein